MYIVFFSTSDVFFAESILKENAIESKVVPTPVSDKAYCGVCLKVNGNVNLNILSELEYNIVEE